MTEDWTFGGNKIDIDIWITKIDTSGNVELTGDWIVVDHTMSAQNNAKIEKVKFLNISRPIFLSSVFSRS